MSMRSINKTANYMYDNKERHLALYSFLGTNVYKTISDIKEEGLGTSEKVSKN